MRRVAVRDVGVVFERTGGGIVDSIGVCLIVLEGF